jgi:hypothetical protein
VVFPEKISFDDQHEAAWLPVGNEAQLPEALQALGLNPPRSVVVLVGGASGLQKEHATIITRATAMMAQLADLTESAIIDGGTQAGVMAWMGQARAQAGYRFPLIGVAAEGVVTWPGGPEENVRTQLEPNHTHFILVSGNHWGDESPWIAKIATQLAGALPSVTILINGGEISRHDVKNSLAAGRPVIILKGTGRLADELASQPPQPLMTVIAAADLPALAAQLRAILTKQSIAK